MTLYIGFVDPMVSLEYMTVAFNDTFDTDVRIEFGATKRNSYGVTYKTAKVYNSTMTSEMHHFISEIRKHGGTSFQHNKIDTWMVRLDEPRIVTEIVYTPPRINY
jgi:hypothetical protein